jgi:hypothetical protein
MKAGFTILRNNKIWVNKNVRRPCIAKRLTIVQKICNVSISRSVTITYYRDVVEKNIEEKNEVMFVL